MFDRRCRNAAAPVSFTGANLVRRPKAEMAYQNPGKGGGVMGTAVVAIAALCCVQQFFATVVTSLGQAIASPAAALYLVAYFPDRISGDSVLTSPVPWSPVVAALAAWASTYRRVAGPRVVAVRAVILLVGAFVTALVVLMLSHPTAEEVQRRASGGGLAATVVLCAVALLMNRRLPRRPGRSLLNRLTSLGATPSAPPAQAHQRPRKRRNRKRRTAPPVGGPPRGGGASVPKPPHGGGGASMPQPPRGGAPFVPQPPRDGTPTGRQHRPPPAGRATDGTPTARPGGNPPQWTDGTPRQRRGGGSPQVDGTPTHRRDR
jgi:hypothetical protein